MDDEHGKALMRQSVGVLLAAENSQATIEAAIQASLANHERCMNEATRLLADIPPGDIEMRDRFLLLIEQLVDSTGDIKDLVYGFYGLASLLTGATAAATGQTRVEILEEIERRLA